MQRSQAASEMAAIERLAGAVGEAWMSVPDVDDVSETPRRGRERIGEEA